MSGWSLGCGLFRRRKGQGDTSVKNNTPKTPSPCLTEEIDPSEKMELRSQGQHHAGTNSGESQGILKIATPKKRDARRKNEHALTDMPDEVMVMIICQLEVKDLCALASSSTRFNLLVESCSEHWKSLFQRSFCTGEATAVQRRAAQLAGSYKKLYQSRVAANAAVAPWEKPSEFEIQASIEQLLFPNSPSSPATENASDRQPPSPPPIASETCVIFLLDSSGSVSEEDFSYMTDFVMTAIRQMITVAAAAASNSSLQVGVLQFSNEVRVEFPVTTFDSSGAGGSGGGDSIEAFDLAVAGIERMNGGTNVSLGVQRAGQLMKEMDSKVHRVIALLSDGRIDDHQARDARQVVARMADEQGNVALHAFGVGRGADKHEMMKIVCGACDDEQAANRYLPLMVLDDAPW